MRPCSVPLRWAKYQLLGLPKIHFACLLPQRVIPRQRLKFSGAYRLAVIRASLNISPWIFNVLYSVCYGYGVRPIQLECSA